MKTTNVGKRTAGLASLLLHRVLPRQSRGLVGILAYHRITERTRGVPGPDLNVTPRRLREQLRGLRRRGFTFVRLRDLLDPRARLQLKEKSVVVTFDDGFANVYSQAWPILASQRIPATVFLCTGFLDSGRPFPFDSWASMYSHRVAENCWRPLDTEECRELLRLGLVDFGAHTHTHRDFRGRPWELQRDLEECLKVLFCRLGLRNVPFSFPYGRKAFGWVGGALTAAVRSLEVSCALTTESSLVDPTSDPFDWGRFNVYEFDTAATLEAKLCGRYGWAPRLHERLSSLGP